MSAAERLKALKELQDRNPHVHILNDSLKIAYPQILAVVEAAEALYERVEMDESVGICLSERVESMNTGAALTALEEALA